MIDFTDLPGHELIERGLSDARNGRTSVESLLVAMAAPRLEALGLPARGSNEPELGLYALLGESSVPDPYSRYNALRRELASFVSALEHRVNRQRRRSASSQASPLACTEDYDANGVDRTLVRACLQDTPLQCLDALEEMHQLAESVKRDGEPVSSID